MAKFDAKRQAVLFATIALMAASCGRAERRDERRARGEQERAEAIKKRQEYVADSTRRADKQERLDYERHVRDSVAEQNGQKRYVDSLDSVRGIWRDSEDLQTMEWSHSLAYAMENELKQTGWPIIAQGEEQIRILLGKYGLEYDGYFSPEKDEYGIVDYFEELFVGITVDGWSFGHTDLWQSYIDKCVDISQYGEERKAEIKNKAAAIIATTEQNLVQNRKAVEARYLDYYSAAPQHFKTDLGIEYGGEGTEYAGYTDLNYVSGDVAMITSRRIDVYDSNLDVDFFGEPGATYKLVQIAEGKWQVVKTRSNGTVEKTPVFSDNKTFETYTDVRSLKDENGRAVPIPTVGASKLWFEAGTNMGVRVYFDEVVKVDRNNKTWTPQYTPAEQRKIDSLQKQIARKAEWADKKYELGRQSDSIARAMTQRRFGNRGQ